MSWIFTIENRIVKPQLETLMIQPFKEIWERDHSEHKAQAMLEFSYIEFMVSVKKTNPYVGYSPEERHARVLKDVMGGSYTPDEVVERAMDWLSDHQFKASASLRYYQSARKAANKLQHFFDTFDMGTTNIRSGAPLYTPKMITSALVDTESVLQKLDAIEQKVVNEIFESVKTKADKKISVFANPDSL